MISFRPRVTVTYPDEVAPALENVSLAIEEGQLALVIGPTGAGKSTLLAGERAGAALLRRPVNGSVTVDGRTTEPPAARPGGRRRLRRTGPRLELRRRHVEDELGVLDGEPRRPASGDAAPGRGRARHVEPASLRQRAIATLSGGQRQRVAIGAGPDGGTARHSSSTSRRPRSTRCRRRRCLPCWRGWCTTSASPSSPPSTGSSGSSIAPTRRSASGGRWSGDGGPGVVTIGSRRRCSPPRPSPRRSSSLGRRRSAGRPLPLSVRDARRHAAALAGHPRPRSRRATARRRCSHAAGAGARARRGRRPCPPPRAVHDPESPSPASTLDFTPRRGPRRHGAKRIGQVDPPPPPRWPPPPARGAGDGRGARRPRPAARPRRSGSSGSCRKTGEPARRRAGREECPAGDSRRDLPKGATRRRPRLARPGHDRRRTTHGPLRGPAPGARAGGRAGAGAATRPARRADPRPRLRRQGQAGRTLRALGSRRGHCVVVATHDVELVAEVADRVVVLADGEVITDGRRDRSLRFARPRLRRWPGYSRR